MALFDTLIAILAGFMIFPALFAFNQDPKIGPGLVFVVLPQIFKTLPFGQLIGVGFFLLLAVAALTSTISLLEVAVAYFVDERQWARKKAVWTVGIATFLIGIPSALSLGAHKGLSEITFLGKTGLLDIMDLLWGNCALALGALFIAIFVGWVWKSENALLEIRQGAKFQFMGKLWAILIKFICPVVIFVILLNLFGITK